MPCFTLQSTKIDLGPKTNSDHMLAALNALNLNALSKAAKFHASGKPAGQRIFFNGGQFNGETGQLILTGDNAEQRAAEIKRAYMTKATMATAAKFGFQVRITGANKFTAIKRSL